MTHAFVETALNTVVQCLSATSGFDRESNEVRVTVCLDKILSAPYLLIEADNHHLSVSVTCAAVETKERPSVANVREFQIVFEKHESLIRVMRRETLAGVSRLSFLPPGVISSCYVLRKTRHVSRRAEFLVHMKRYKTGYCKEKETLKHLSVSVMCFSSSCSLRCCPRCTLYLTSPH